MADTAAHLVDRVFPVVPARQWVLSFPFALRYRMAYDARLTTDILNVFIRALFGGLRRRARRWLGLSSSRYGAVTFVQRFGDALNSNVHFHCVAIDGVYAGAEGGRPEFHALPAPEEDEVLCLADSISRRVKALLLRRGIGEQADLQQADPLSHDDPGMAALFANSVRNRIAVGANRGRWIVRLGDQIDGDNADPYESPRCAMVSGFSIHANTCIDGRDRRRLERLLRYCLRPAVAVERLTELPDGRLLYRLKRPWRDGTTAVVFERQDFVARLAALTPAPHCHLTRFHGVLAPAAAWRSFIVPRPRGNTENPVENSLSWSPGSVEPRGNAEPLEAVPVLSGGRNYSWAELMKRVFRIDVLKCENCGGPMKMIAVIDEPELIGKILESVGLISRAPPASAASLRIHH
jgi:hypothetical protein